MPLPARCPLSREAQAKQQLLKSMRRRKSSGTDEADKPQLQPSADWEPLWFEAGQGGGGSSRSLISLKISFVERLISPSGSSL